MNQVRGHQAAIEKLYAAYKEKGFLREEEALSVMATDNLSLVDINRITDRLIALGVVFADDSSTDEDDNDYAQIDYEALYRKALEISPGQQLLIDYIREVRPPQNREWRPLITQMNSGNQYAFNRLFDMYLRVIVRIALRFYEDTGFELDDAIQEGSMGLMRAIRQYDSSKHGNLGSYLPLWIQQYIGRAVADKGRTIRIPVHAYDSVQKLQKSKELLFEQKGYQPSNADIAATADIPIEMTTKLLEVMQEPVSLEALLQDGNNEDIINEYFVLPSFEEKLDEKLLGVFVRNSLFALSERERRILSLRYGLEDDRERTLEEVGIEFNVTRERVRQIESKALKKLHQRFENTMSKMADDFDIW